MTIKDLIADLQQFPDNMEVMLATDSEGNSYHPDIEYVLTEGVRDEKPDTTTLTIRPLNTKNVIYPL